MSDASPDLRHALAGRFDIERELGGGGMSQVFVATETALDRSVVIKVIAPGLLEVTAGRRAEALVLARRMIPVSTVRRQGFYAAALGLFDARDEAAAVIRSIEPRSAAPGAMAGLVVAYLGVGDVEHALTAMETVAAGDGDLLLASVPAMPIFDPIRQNPRFAAVLKRFNLDVARLAA